MLRLLLALLLALCINGPLHAAIDPVYDGSNGIRNSVLTVCLQCHSASVTGAGRNGATSIVNFDTYAAAASWADLLMTKAVIERSMPPAGYTPLNSEQRSALLAWQAAGFPEKSTAAPDTQAPATPAKPTATVIGTTEINLAWTPTTDNVAVTAYKIYRGDRGGSPIATLGNVTVYVDKTLIAATAYSFSVAACDAAGNCSAPSAAVTVTTPLQSDCLFDWAEQSFPDYFSPPAQSRSLDIFYYRLYPPATYLAIAAGQLWYLGPLTGNTAFPLGDVATWYSQAKCN